MPAIKNKMELFFIDKSQIDGHKITISGGDVNHIKNVLRKRVGDEIACADGSSSEYRCRIESFEDEKIICSLEFIKEADTELPVRVHLFQGIPKGDKFELIIQKCVELGVYEIIPVECERCVVKLDAKKAEKKITRYNAISEAAAKQSKRRIIPEVTMPVSFKEALKMAKDMDIKLIPYELSDMGMDNTRDIFSNIKDDIDIAVFIGPEGGFCDSEISLAGENSFLPITLGRRILRTETAGMTVMGWIMYQKD